jgi:glycosyltransferase involved in cell wall biosynthesis
LWDLKRTFRKIYKKSVHVFWVSPWAKPQIESLLCYKNTSYSFFPNICHIENIKNTFLNDKRNRYCTVVSLHQMKRKGLLPLLEAISLLVNDGVFIKLDIIGGGDDKYFDEINKKIHSLNIEQYVRVLGPLPHDALLVHLSKSKGLLLPAINETFGMAYIEAIASGVPVLFMSDTGIDGHFEAKKVGVRIDSQDPESIKNGIVYLEENHEYLLKSIFYIVDSNDLKRFTGPSLGQLYISCLEDFFND